MCKTLYDFKESLPAQAAILTAAALRPYNANRKEIRPHPKKPFSIGSTFTNADKGKALGPERRSLFYRKCCTPTLHYVESGRLRQQT